jgi:hypothetical protein
MPKKLTLKKNSVTFVQVSWKTYCVLLHVAGSLSGATLVELPPGWRESDGDEQ